MSKMEPTEFINDRYAAMEERLAVSGSSFAGERRRKNRKREQTVSFFFSRQGRQGQTDEFFFSCSSIASSFFSTKLSMNKNRSCASASTVR